LQYISSIKTSSFIVWQSRIQKEGEEQTSATLALDTQAKSEHSQVCIVLTWAWK